MLTKCSDASIECELVSGHQIASGTNPDSPYPGGSIALQIPCFMDLGLDLSSFYPATLNLSIAPSTFRIQQADYRFDQVQWVTGFNPETFSFVACEIEWNKQRYQGFVYYPHPETKTRDFHNASLIEIIAPKINGIGYGDKVKFVYPSDKITIQKSNPC